MKKPTALIIMDGWGQANASAGNAVEMANTPNYDRLLEKYPHTLIAASGLDVGLPEGQMGNSEVGHLNIGAGVVVRIGTTPTTGHKIVQASNLVHVQGS